MDCKYDIIKQAVSDILGAIGEDTEREGLQDTPTRVANFWSEFIDFDPGRVDVTFESITTDQMVILTGINTWSLCEHHLLPFSCDVSIGYLTNEKVIGLSKLARIVHKYAHRLQIQERFTHQIADEVQRITGTDSVAVLSKGIHLCMVMRGVKTEGTMITSALRGRFLDNNDSAPREEFHRLVMFAK